VTVPRRGGDEVPAFRSLAAPGLEEDDLFAALQGLPVPGPFWGDGWPAPRRGHEDRPWCQDDERRRRHERLMRKWGADGGPPPR